MESHQSLFHAVGSENVLVVQLWQGFATLLIMVILNQIILSVKVLVTKLRPMYCDPRDCSPPGSSIHGTSQARTLERAAISFSRESSQPRDQTQVSCIADVV